MEAKYWKWLKKYKPEIYEALQKEEGKVVPVTNITVSGETREVSTPTGPENKSLENL